MYFTSVSHLKVLVEDGLYNNDHSIDNKYLEAPVRKIIFSTVSVTDI